MSVEIDFYELLGVERGADDATIKSAYRRLAMQHHPDRNSGCKDNEDKFKAISAAYEVLKDPQKRAAYDRYGHAAFQNGGPGGGPGFGGQDFGDLGDIFETIFGSAFGGAGARQRPRGEGRVDKVQKLTVEVPPGVDTGTRIRLSGKGEAGPYGAPPGDLYIFVHVKPHPVFEREGTILFTRAPISFTTAALGGCIEIPGLDGEVSTIDIPAGIQSGKQLRKRGAGMPVLQGRGRGDLVVEVKVETPTRLTPRQREILRELQETETGDECPESRGFFEKLKGALGG